MIARAAWDYIIKVEKQRAGTEAEDVGAGSRSYLEARTSFYHFFLLNAL